jgi:tetratricopeptide (TPR) repeat protein
MNHQRTLGLAALLLFGLTAFALNAADANQLHEQAQKLAGEKKYDEAIEAMKEAVKAAPSNDLFLARLSDYEYKAGKYADGVKHALEAVRLNDKVGPYYVLVALNAYGDQDLARARDYCERVLKAGPAKFGEGACKDAKILLPLLLKRTYTLHWNLDPKNGRPSAGTYAVAVPKDNLAYQSASFEINGARSHRLVRGTVNDILYIVPKGADKIELTTKVTVKPYSYKKTLADAKPKPLPVEARANLGSCDGINVNSPALKKAVAGLKGKSEVETAHNILAWMKEHIEYKLDKSDIVKLDFKTVDDLLKRGHAECRGYALLFTALCRAAGVPARPIWGLAAVAPGQDQRFGAIASHNWAEIYVAGCGWIPVDPQRPETLGCLPTSCIRIFMDAKKTRNSAEPLPMLNLMFMNGEKLKFDEKIGE